jgi:hypothetical protein
VTESLLASRFLLLERLGAESQREAKEAKRAKRAFLPFLPLFAFFASHLHTAITQPIVKEKPTTATLPKP